MNQEVIIGIVAFAALAAVIIFRKSAVDPLTIPTVEKVGASQTIETPYGPHFLTYNQPYQSAFFNPIPQPPMPYMSVGQVGQTGCATC